MDWPTCKSCGYVRTDLEGALPTTCPKCEMPYVWSGTPLPRSYVQMQAQLEKAELAKKHARLAEQEAAEQARTSGQEQQPVAEMNSRRNQPSLFGFILLTLGITWLTSSSDDSSVRAKLTKTGAQIACEARAKMTLKSPSTAEFAPFHEVRFSGSDGGPFHVWAYVDAQNSFGATLRSRFYCTVESNGAEPSVTEFEWY